jgi:thioesterase domain-containing protein
LALGYFRRSELTAAQFIPNPYGDQPGGRLYRSGDLGRRHSNGDIEFLGRADQQVKLRGVRIELGEIESVVKHHPSVLDAVAVLRQLSKDHSGIVCYVAARAQALAPHLAEELRRFLGRQLPDYAMPAAIVVLERLPLTASGKIDRRSLPNPDVARSETSTAPRDTVERRLARVWESLLGVHPVGVLDNFFELGGHSLLAVRLMTEIEREFGRRIPLVSLFQDATIESLAGILRENVGSVDWPTLVKIQEGGARPPLFCVSMPNVNALGYRSLAKYLGPEQPVYGLQAQYPEDLHGEHSNAAVDTLARDYLKAMQELQPDGPYQLIGHCRGAHIAYEMARQLRAAGQRVALLGIVDTWVMENTLTWFWRLSYSAKRRASQRWRRLKQAIDSLRSSTMMDVRAAASNATTSSLRSPLHEVYFPGPGFAPRTYDGRVSVFRVRKQPFSRIRDRALDWGRLAKGGVDLHIVPGSHFTVLQEPNVRVLAAALQRHLLQGNEP